MNTAILPTPKLEADFYDWYERHREKCQLVKERRYDLIFIGDSITHFWEVGDDRGKAVWDELFVPLRALILGFGWDRTQNVLWRLEHGEFTGQTPGVVVLLIGTNNLTGTANARTNTPEEIAEGVAAIVDRIQELSPTTAVLTVGILPRDTPQSMFASAIPATNRLLQAQADPAGKRHFIDIGPCLLGADGALDPVLVPGLVHLVEAGYRAMAEQLLPIIRELNT